MPRTSLRGRLTRLCGLGAVVTATVALSQVTASGAFVGVTGNAGSSVSSAATFCTAPTNRPAISGDSWTDEASPSTNHLSNLELKVRSGSSTTVSTRRHIWIGFDTVSNPDPAHCQLTQATLSLYNKTPESGRYIDVYRGAAAWTAATIVWSNEPGYLSTPVATTTQTPSTAGWQTWNVTALVQAQYDTGVNNGFLLRDRAENAVSTNFQQVYYDRQDTTFRGTLVLTWG